MIRELKFPELSEYYESALRQAISFVEQQFEPLGIIAGGSIIRGNPGPTSDFDIYVIHDKPWRQRLQMRFNGTPAEIFVNNPAAVRSYFESERKAGRPITAHILTTGVVIVNRDPIVDQLIGEAQEWLGKRPDLSDAELLWKRYLIVDGLDNARDLMAVDPANAVFFLNDALQAMVNYAFLAENQNLPRFKEIITKLEAIQPELGALVRSFYNTADHKQQLQIVESLATQMLGVTEFFEWKSEAQPFP